MYVFSHTQSKYFKMGEEVSLSIEGNKLYGIKGGGEKIEVKPSSILEVVSKTKTNFIKIVEGCVDRVTPQVGLEMEMVSAYSREDVEDKMHEIAQNKVSDYRKYLTFDTARDGSIRCDRNKCFCTRSEANYHCYKVEVRFLISNIEATQTKIVLKALFDFFKDKNKFSFNDSCGLHVHLDSRGIRPTTIYQNLTRALPSIIQLCSNRRQLSAGFKRYAPLNGLEEMYKRPNYLRYRSINFQSYEKHQTVEVRCHEMTFDFEKVLNWILTLREISYNVSQINEPIRTRGAWDIIEAGQ